MIKQARQFASPPIGMGLDGQLGGTGIAVAASGWAGLRQDLLRCQMM
jgi:hypothetical protein